MQHPFLKEARATRVSQLSDEFIRRNEEIVVGEDDLRAVSFVVVCHVCCFENIENDRLITSLLFRPKITNYRHSKLSQEFPVF